MKIKVSLINRMRTNIMQYRYYNEKSKKKETITHLDFDNGAVDRFFLDQ